MTTCKDHTPCPKDYIAWHAWAREKGKTHKSVRCDECHLYKIWVEKPEPMSCRTCSHLSLVHDWEQPQYDYYICGAKTGYDNVWSFPFKNTHCVKHSARPS